MEISSHGWDDRSFVQSRTTSQTTIIIMEMPPSVLRLLGEPDLVSIVYI